MVGTVLEDKDAIDIVLTTALPPAVLNYMVAEQYQQDPKRVASIVLIGNLMALVSIPITLSFAATATNS